MLKGWKKSYPKEFCLGLTMDKRWKTSKKMYLSKEILLGWDSPLGRFHVIITRNFIIDLLSHFEVDTVFNSEWHYVPY
jgi:hypothetical protein